MKTIRYLENRFIILLSLVLRTVAFPFLLLYFLRRIARDRHWLRKLGERFGGLPASFSRTPPGAVWLHAVSVGEILSSIELLKQIRAAQPHAPLYVSTTTLAGRAVADEKLRGLAAGVFYLPIDYGFAIRRVLRAIRPNVVVILETELWPVLFRTVTRAGCALLIVNGRISDRAWPRYRRMRWFFRHVLEYPRLIAVQSEADRQRFLALAGWGGQNGGQTTACAPGERFGQNRGQTTACAPGDSNHISESVPVLPVECPQISPPSCSQKIEVFGNLKYDAAPATAPPPPAIARLIEALHPEGVWIAASTTAAAEPGDVDEDSVIAAFRQLASDHPRLLLILVPRKPERFPLAAARLTAAGVPFLRRSELTESGTGYEFPRREALGDDPLAPAESRCLSPNRPLPGVLLLDTLGELNSIFPLADVVFMGGTLARRGGHNILEPAAAGKPIIVGPHMENFAAIAAEFRAADAVVDIAGPADLTAAVRDLLRDPARRASLGARARELALLKRGATDRAVRAIVEARDLAVPRFEGRGAAYPLLAPLALLWKAGTWWRAVAPNAGRQRRWHWHGRRRQDPHRVVPRQAALRNWSAARHPHPRLRAQILRARGHRSRRPASVRRKNRRRGPDLRSGRPFRHRHLRRPLRSRPNAGATDPARRLHPRRWLPASPPEAHLRPRAD